MQKYSRKPRLHPSSLTHSSRPVEARNGLKTPLNRWSTKRESGEKTETNLLAQDWWTKDGNCIQPHLMDLFILPKPPFYTRRHFGETSLPCDDSSLNGCLVDCELFASIGSSSHFTLCAADCSRKRFHVDVELFIILLSNSIFNLTFPSTWSSESNEFSSFRSTQSMMCLIMKTKLLKWSSAPLCFLCCWKWKFSVSTRNKMNVCR